MSRMRTKTGGKRTRRSFAEEFKSGAVRLVFDEGKTIGAVARELDLTPSGMGYDQVTACNNRCPAEGPFHHPPTRGKAPTGSSRPGGVR